ncbi:MAG: class II aldolase/adducin family protein [Eubacteriales bacterium]|nr:class II aldolase/adducin family protein [Eubacteriales bacterium]
MMEAGKSKQQVVDFSKRAFERKLFAGTSGNLSVYDREKDRIYITPSSVRYETMQPADVMVIDLAGKVLEGPHKPSSEWRLHTAVYAVYPQIGALVHTHSPFATAFAVNREEIPATLIEMFFFLGGSIPCAPYACPGTAEVGAYAVPLLEDKGGCLLANHGVLAVGKDMEQAYIRAEYIEDAAKIYSIAKLVGTPAILSALEE